MKPNRRNLLALGGGAAAGLVFTPVPWSLLTHSAKWTQNWPWIPQPARGPVEVKAATCSLCPHGCGMQVRMCAGFPVGISPANGGALCPLAFGAHQLNSHPKRLREVRHRGRPVTMEDAAAAWRKARAEGPVMVVDGRPGRGVSKILRGTGGYAVAHGPEERSLAPYAAWSGVDASALSYDLESAHTIVSFGAPLLDGWGAPGRFSRLWRERAAGRANPDLRLIQVEPTLSRTASLSWRWVPNRPGSDAALAAGLARVLIEENLTTFKGPMPAISLDSAARESDIPREAIVELARTIAAGAPALAISGDEQPTVAALNLLLGGGIVQRKASPAAMSSPGALRAIAIDSTVPWDYQVPAGPEVFRFAAWDGGGTQPEWLIPSPGFLEEVTEHPAAPGSAVSTYAISPALLAPPPGVTSCAAFLGGGVQEAIQARCEEIYRMRTGRLYRRDASEAVALNSIESSAKLYDELSAGAIWSDTPGNSRKLRCELREWPASTPIPLRADWSARWAASVLPPLGAKLYQESNLREAPMRSRI